MRLLQRLPGGDFELTSHDDEQPPPYAILSHTWNDGQEVTYNELVAGTGKDKTGYVKIRFCGEQAASDGLRYFWVDTCCIDKSTSTELSTAINSMFRWYQRASRCYVYLSDVSVPEEVADTQAFRITWVDAFRRSRWFTRGWTLQELLAPATVEFFSVEGKKLGHKISLEQEIHKITDIPSGALRGQSLTDFTIDQRKSWAAKRTTTLREDKVYCLLGIFGVFLPLIYGEGEDYATQRLEEEIQRRQKGQKMEASHDMSISSVLPFPRNERFVGREDELQSLEKFFFSPTTHQRMTLHGLGGCGKSALALEFAYRALSRLARRLVFWVPAISRESFELAYRDIATRLRLHGITDGNKDINKLVKDTLNSENFGSWLMIVDNADDPKVLSDTVDGDPKLTRLVDYLPHSSRGAILFTTRSRKAAGSLTPGYVLELKDMTQAEARQLLTQRTMKPILLQDDIAVNELLEILTCLPLAIVQAAAFLSNNDISVRKYISLFRNPGAEIELFSEQFEDPSRYREMDSTIAKTWHISFDQMRKQDQLAADYLSFMACINRINIPQSLLPPNGSLVQQAKALGTLTGYAFITERQQMVQRVDGERFFDMHRLVHMASVSWLDGQGKRATWADIAADRLMKLVPHSGHERKEVWMPYISHAMHSAGLEGAVKEISRASLLRQVGGCQMSLGQYSAAEATCRRASPLYRKVMGPEHPETLRSINNLAEVLYNQGKYEETESMERQVLAQRERLLGSEHPDTLSSKSNLARVLDMQGEYEEAELMNRQALAQREIILGPEHPDTLTSMGNLAIVISNQGKNEEAELMHRQVLAKRETVLGPEHPDTLKSMNSLAIVIGNQGKYEEAELMHRQVLAQKERLLWPEHPDMLTSMNSLAIVISNQGKYEEAELMHRQVIALRERLLGSEHPDTLGSKSNLAGVLYRQGKYEEVELIERQVLAQRERLLGSEHPDALTSMNNLALAIVEQGRYEEAEVIHRQVLAQRKIALGPEHPVTLSSIGNLAVVLYRQGKYEETESMERQVLAQRERLLGSEHPDTLRSISNLARVLDRQEKYEEAEVIHRQVLGHQERVLRLKHPATLMSVYWLAYNLASQQRYDESLALYERAYTGFCTVLGNDHPTTRECLHFYAEAKKQAALSTLSPYILDNGVSRY